MIYELRTYYAAPGKMDALNKRFREHTCNIFERHGMTVVGFWSPEGKEQEVLVYMLGFQDAEHMKKCWESFVADEEWTKVRADSEVDGELVSSLESSVLIPTDYSAIR